MHHTEYISAEGDRDYSFVEYIRVLYRNQNRKVKVGNAHGGSPVKQVMDIIRREDLAGFDNRTAMFDTDRGEKEVAEARKIANGRGVRCLEADSNIEVELLRILGAKANKISKVRNNAKAAKDELRKSLKLKDENSSINWEKYFPRELLDEKRKTSPWLDTLIGIIQG